MNLNQRSQIYQRATILMDRNQINRPKMFCKDLVEGGIALLSDVEIACMSRDDLQDVIRIAKSKQLTVGPHLNLDLDDASLRRLLQILRRLLRARIDLQSRIRGWGACFNEPI